MSQQCVTVCKITTACHLICIYNDPNHRSPHATKTRIHGDQKREGGEKLPFSPHIHLYYKMATHNRVLHDELKTKINLEAAREIIIFFYVLRSTSIRRSVCPSVRP